MNQKTTRLWAAILTLSLLLPLAACGKDTVATTMHLKRTEGTVTVSDDAKKDVPLLENLGLYSGYGVDTHSESYAWISLDDVKLTKMDQESEISIQKEGKALDIEVISGSLFFNVTQPLEDDETMNIRTSTILIGIRGTCGWVEERDGLSRVYILEGTVECTAGGNTVQVSAGEMAELTADGRLVVQPFTVQDIPAFVMDDLTQDPDLCSDIYNASGLDVLGTAGGEEGSESAEGTENSVDGTDSSAEYHAELILQLSEYESYGYAIGGVMPVQKDGLWGAINFKNEVVVPFTYSGFYAAPDLRGDFVLYQSTVEQETWDFMGETRTREVTRNTYTLFDADGNTLYEGAKQVRASGGLYIIVNDTEDENYGATEYYKPDGTLLLSVQADWGYLTRTVGFYDGKSSVISATNVEGEPESYRLGTVFEDGSVTWHAEHVYQYDPIYQEPTSQESQSSTDEGNQGLQSDAGGGGFAYICMGLVNTANNGYYILNNPYLEGGYFYVYDEEENLVASFNLCEMKPDAELGFTYSPEDGYYDEGNGYRGFYHDGCYLYHYGSHMVLMLGGKDVLVDFSRSPGMTAETMNNSIVTAVYDRIYMADENYWLVQNDSQYGYIDHDGTEIAMFENASGFYQQHAMIIENGHAYLINEDMEKLQDLGEAVSVSMYGELFRVDRGSSYDFYQLAQ